MAFRGNFLKLVPFHLREYYANLSVYLSLNANSLMWWNFLRSLPSLKRIDRLCKDNYRPVSILTALSKVFEMCHSNQLLFYFEELFSKFLSGFRKGYGCRSTLLRMIEDWKSSLDYGNNVGTIAMWNKAGRQLNVLQRPKGSLDYGSRLSIYKSFIMSNFNYCPVVWMFTSKSSLLKLETIKKRALRFVLDDYASDCYDLLKKADVPGIMKIMAFFRYSNVLMASTPNIWMTYLLLKTAHTTCGMILL